MHPGIRPIASRAYRTNPAVAAQVIVMLDPHLDAGFIRKSNLPWAFPLVAVPKKDRNTRTTPKCKPLDDVAIIGELHIPHIDEVLTPEGKAKFSLT